MPSIHPLLARLIRRTGACMDAVPSLEVWQGLLGLISRTYHDADQDRYTLERSIDISSRELQGLYENLKRYSATEIAKQRRALQESYAIIRATLEAANAGIVVVDRHARILAVNKRFAEVFAVPDEIVASTDHATVVAFAVQRCTDPADQQRRIQEIHASRDIDHCELTLVDGKIIERYSAPIHLPDGDVVGRVTFFRDVTDERTLNQQLERARGAAEAANQAKTMFLASMSHELRTPLNAVIGLADLLAIDDELTAEQHEYVDGIIESGRHLLALVNDVLDLAKVEAGKQDFYPEPIDACEAIEDAVSMLAPLADHRGVVLEARVPHSRVAIYADPLRFRQILYNLISNAVKFTGRDGRVDVTAFCEGACVAIAVADQGIGIAQEEHSRLFRAFEQLPMPDGGRPIGTGLGLALTKRLVDMHGGNIDLVSQRGVGTTFTVRIPSSAMELS